MSNRVRVFTEQLFIDGAVRVSGDIAAHDDEVEAAVDWVWQAELQLHDHYPLVPPTVDRPALKWAIRQFFSAAQLAVFRQLGPEELTQRLGQEITADSDSPAVTYSVDLIFRFLPDLVRIVKGMNPDDPLLKQLRHWGERWPLSSVGIPGLSISKIEPILENRCLSMLYVDRIIEAEAVDRLNHPQLQDLVRGAIGAYPEFSPKLYRFLTTQQHVPTEQISDD